MNSRDTAFTVAAIKLGIFTLVSVIVTGMLVVIMGGFGLGSQTEYKAVFSSASELTAGDQVRIAGVVVGKVKDVKIHHRTEAMVTFKVKDGVPLTQDSRASIRFLNLIGDRYMSLEQGKEGSPRLKPGSTLQLNRTTPALNLTELFQGFQPLFAALRPEDVNKLSLNLIQVLQGEGGTVQELLSHTASLTSTLADRDELIGDVITNLTSLMTTVDDHHQQLDELLTSMRSWFGDLAKDRKVIGSSLTNISQVTKSVADLLTEGRPLLKADVAQLRRLFTVLAKPENKAYLDETLDLLPSMLAKQTRIGVYGSWYNYYLCEFHGGVVLPSALMDTLPADVQKQMSDFTLYSNAKRCR
ncbi:MCE family protein [Aeromicrobium sp. 9AM]|uniref:MCE family protein n=1 Tax=Aeromicrobium sp. 9AM TaxID=2653126 RepID=UPI0012F159D4|nr:MCE family protein [Aeromicrobium sp. 9AM]VXC25986.1 Virulence factor Mce [Aeromicrobium sp. 9AM]